MGSGGSIEETIGWARIRSLARAEERKRVIPMSAMYDAVKDLPAFKRFCARKSTKAIAKPKRFKVPIPKRSGINSVLKDNRYTTGRYLRVQPAEGESYCAAEEAYLFKIENRFESVVVNFGDATVEDFPQGVAEFFDKAPGLNPEKESEAA